MTFKTLIEVNQTVGDIPFLEIQPMSQDAKEAIIYYHGYRSSKEQSRFVGKMLASLGYLVLLPDQLGHGERTRELSVNFGEFDPKMWEIIVDTITTSPNLIHYLATTKGFSPNHITLSGHSMGAMAAAGAFVKNPIGKLVAFNGCLSYKTLLDNLPPHPALTEERLHEMKQTMQYYDPAEHLARLENRPVLLIDGEEDKLLPPQINQAVVEALLPFYKQKALLEHAIIHRGSHAITLEAFARLERYCARKEIQEYGL